MFCPSEYFYLHYILSFSWPDFFFFFWNMALRQCCIKQVYFKLSHCTQNFLSHYPGPEWISSFLFLIGIERSFLTPNEKSLEQKHCQQENHEKSGRNTVNSRKLFYADSVQKWTLWGKTSNVIFLSVHHTTPLFFVHAEMKREAVQSHPKLPATETSFSGCFYRIHTHYTKY